MASESGKEPGEAALPAGSPCRAGLTAGFWALFKAGTIVAALCTLTVFVGRAWWFLELWSHFCAQYLFCLAAATAVFAAWSRWRWVVGAGAFVAVNLALVVPFYLGSPPGSGRAAQARVLLLNLHSSNRETERVLRLVEREKPDLLVLMEVTSRWACDLEPLHAEYPFRWQRPRGDNFGLAVLSRREFLSCRPVELGEAGVPSLLCQVGIAERSLTVIATHPLPPVGSRYAGLRNAQLRDTAALAAREERPLAVVGDLNVTPWSPWFRLLLREGGLRNGRKGHGLRPTWPAFCLPLRIPIDHCLVSDTVIVRRFRTGPPVGSDHLPVIVDLSLSGPSP